MAIGASGASVPAWPRSLNTRRRISRPCKWIASAFSRQKRCQPFAPCRPWKARLGQRFEGRTLPVNHAVWRLWAEQSASAERDGQPLSPMDGLIMASALSRGLGLVTRNTADFARHPQVFNPWAA